MQTLNKYILLTIAILLFQLNSVAQNIDSLNFALKVAKHDTTKLRLRFIIGEAKGIKTIAFWDSLLIDAKILRYLKIEAAVLNNIGLCNLELGDFSKASYYYNQSLKIRETIDDKIGIAESYMNMGSLYIRTGDFVKAFSYLTRSLKICEKIGDKFQLAFCYNSIGNLYSMKGDNSKALAYHKKSLDIIGNNGSKYAIATFLSRISEDYLYLGNDSLAFELCLKSLKIQESIGDKIGIGQSLNNLGKSKEASGDTIVALEYWHRSLKIKEEIGDLEGQALTLSNIANTLSDQGEFDEALVFGLRSLNLAKTLDSPSLIYNATYVLAFIYKEQKKFDKALEMNELFIEVMVKLNQEDINKKLMQFDFNKKELELKAEQDKKDLITIEEKRKQKIITYSVSIGFIIVLVLGLFLLRGFKEKQKTNLIITKQKQEVEVQKHLVEEKHKEITDSINYAERIQRSFLATSTLLNSNLKDYFVYFKPKDVVSGDFYWAKVLSNETFALVTADSTGHGVPGAIMSLLNITSLESAIKEGNNEPSEILNHTRETIVERLKLDGSAEGGKDGMDASLVCFDFKNNKFTYAAANNPIWVIRDNNLIELKVDKMPVGKHDKDQVPFTQYEFEMNKGDVIYTLTDGFPDQFGGTKGKKFMYKQLKETLVSISQKPMAEQKDKLNSILKNWMGDVEQVDDITIIGIRV